MGCRKNSMFSTPVLVFSRVSGLYWIFRSGIKEFADQSTLTNYKLIEQLSTRSTSVP